MTSLTELFNSDILDSTEKLSAELLNPREFLNFHDGAISSAL